MQKYKFTSFQFRVTTIDAKFCFEFACYKFTSFQFRVTTIDAKFCFEFAKWREVWT